MAERVRLEVEEYLAEVLALVNPLDEPESVPIAAAAGRTLAEPVTARVNVPGFDNSAMDGFAVQFDGIRVGDTLREVGDVPAGSGLDPDLGPGECVRIMTGAPVPSRADTIIQREFVTELPDAFAPGQPGVVVNQLPARRGLHVRHAGEDFQVGQVLIEPGALLGPHHVSLAASSGAGEVQVVRRPRVVVVATGDELVPPGGDLRPGQIHESNLTQLAASLQADGAEVVQRLWLPDDPEAFSAGLDGAAGDADLIVMSGGVSAGDHDVVRIALGERAEGTFRHVQMQPGKPQGWARWNGTPVLGLPGNPLSTAISYHLFVRPIIEKFLGRPERPWSAAVAAEGWDAPPGRRQFIPVSVEHDQTGRRLVRPAHRRGSASHMVSALTWADGIVDVPTEVDRVEAGDIVRVRGL
ncbi:gephyrin-like molybdotransferase Glp [Propionibacteriaceae bacterium Y1923]